MRTKLYVLTIACGVALPLLARAGALDKPGAATPKPGGSSTALAPPSSDADVVVGRWKFGGDIWVIRADGKLRRSHPGFGEDGTWQLIATGTPSKYEINWSGGRSLETIFYSPGQDKFLKKGKNGHYNPIGERAVQ